MNDLNLPKGISIQTFPRLFIREQSKIRGNENNISLTIYGDSNVMLQLFALSIFVQVS